MEVEYDYLPKALLEYAWIGEIEYYAPCAQVA
ncbi:hypothetical protein M2271_008129 [Streptomyces sp. LBL]|nr:hypothetical protein [Streptomyces sp. LBL]